MEVIRDRDPKTFANFYHSCVLLKIKPGKIGKRKFNKILKKINKKLINGNIFYSDEVKLIREIKVEYCEHSRIKHSVILWEPQDAKINWDINDISELIRGFDVEIRVKPIYENNEVIKKILSGGCENGCKPEISKL